MEKILVNVYVPILRESYDIFIPSQSQFFQVSDLIKKAIYELSAGQFIPSVDTTVSFRGDGIIPDVNKTILELGIKNGAKLMLI